MKKEKIISICVIFLAVTSIIFFSGCSKDKNAPAYQMNLEVWGFIDDSDAFREINQNYRNLNPQIKQIQYKKVSSNIEEFEKELLNAIASGKGPDMIFFHNSWLMEHKDKIASHPLSERYLSQFNKKFIDVASSDFIEENEIYAMPLHSDTLALFYNKEIFNQEGLTKAPATWEELAEYTRKITDLKQDGTFSRSAIALGRSSVPPGEINRASDIMNLLFLQNDIQMIDDRGILTAFNRDVLSSSSLDFYTSFAKDSPLYTWNSKMEGSVDSFRFGKTAMMINYSYMANKLRSTDPKFNFEIAPVPQIDLDKKVNYSNYWGLAVVKNKALIPEATGQRLNYNNEDRIKESWRYIKYVTMGTLTNQEGQEIAMNPDPTELYLETTQKPSARKDLIEKQKNDPELGVFAVQALTAKSWKRPSDTFVEPIFDKMIDDVVNGKSTTRKAIDSASNRINVVIKDLTSK